MSLPRQCNLEHQRQLSFEIYTNKQLINRQLCTDRLGWNGNFTRTEDKSEIATRVGGHGNET